VKGLDEMCLFKTEVHNIIPESVGQYTGLTDKNGKEIYEGDVVNGNLQIHFYNGAFVAVICGSIPFTDNCYQIYWIVVNEYCVIGNIYENPELLNSLK
jgi:uncharacterized phage protein (TIGR01671 family)